MRNVHLLTPVRTALNLSPVRQSFEDFILSRQAMRCTPATLEHYHYTAAVFVSWLELHGVQEPKAITAGHVREWLAEAVSLKPASLHARARGVRTMLRFFHAEGYIPAEIKISMPRLEKQRLPFLDEEELTCVLKACQTPRHKVMILFLADSGVRREELALLNWEDVNFSTGGVMIRKGKGNKARLAVIGPHTRRALLAYRRTIQPPKDGSPLIQTLDGARLSGGSITRILKRIGKRAGIALSPHMLRRTFALLSLRAGMDVISLQRLMGHADISMTAHYIQFVDADLIAAHNAASPIDRARG